jgi:Domain of unknown function (DUF1707)
MAGPGDEMAAAEGRNRDDLRASHADREQVIGALTAAFVQGRLTEDELDARAGQVYASRTYAELDGVTADIPAEPTGARSPRDPWRATKIVWRVVYAIIAPGLVTLILIPGGPRTTVADVVILATVVYFVFWVLGVCLMVGSRQEKRSGGQLPPRSAPGALAEAPAMTGPGDEAAAHAAGGYRLPVSSMDREPVIRALRVALAQGRLTEDELDARAAQASASQSRDELAALTADLPAGLLARQPKASYVRTGVCLSVAAAIVVAGFLLWQPDNALAFMAFVLAALTLPVAPVITGGLMLDVRHQRRSGGRLPPGPAPSPGG